MNSTFSSLKLEFRWVQVWAFWGSSSPQEPLFKFCLEDAELELDSTGEVFYFLWRSGPFHNRTPWQKEFRIVWGLGSRQGCLFQLHKAT